MYCVIVVLPSHIAITNTAAISTDATTLLNSYVYTFYHCCVATTSKIADTIVISDVLLLYYNYYLFSLFPQLLPLI